MTKYTDNKKLLKMVEFGRDNLQDVYLKELKTKDFQELETMVVSHHTYVGEMVDRVLDVMPDAILLAMVNNYNLMVSSKYGIRNPKLFKKMLQHTDSVIGFFKEEYI